MDKNEIARMARQAGMLVPGHRTDIEELERFAALVATAEREQFVAECIDLVAMYGGSVDLEAAIRARGNHANG